MENPTIDTTTEFPTPIQTEDLSSLIKIPYHEHSGREGDGPQIDKKNVVGNPLLAKVYLSGAQSLTQHAPPYDKVLFDAQDYNYGMTVDLTNHRITANVAGYYLIITQLGQQSSSDNALFIARINVNGVEKTYAPITSAGTSNICVSSTSVFFLNKNDYVEVTGYGNQVLDNNIDRTYLIVTKL